MSDKIVYTLISNAGGYDGLDFKDKGGDLRAAFWARDEANKSKLSPWCTVVAIVVDTDKAKREALAKLSPLDKLVLGL